MPLPNRTRGDGDKVGTVLFEASALPAVYTFGGDALYVRAKVTSSKAKADPFEAGDLDVAWAQPVVP